MSILDRKVLRDGLRTVNVIKGNCLTRLKDYFLFYENSIILLKSISMYILKMHLWSLFNKKGVRPLLLP